MMKRLLAGLVMVGVAVLGTAGCAAETSEDDGDVEQLGDVGEQLLAGTKLTPHQTANYLRNAGFPGHVIGPMVCTAKYESSFYTKASNRNSNGSVDRGLFQINSIHLGDSGCTRSASALYDPATNARCAHEIWRSQGLNAWYGYQHHRYECDHTAAP